MADFNHDISIGFSASNGHNDKKWEIVIGGWSGTRSVIRSKNEWPIYGHVGIDHSLKEFNEFKQDLKVQHDFHFVICYFQK